MAITDYATLQTTIQDYADNATTLTAARVQTAIQMAEGEIGQILTQGLEAGRKIRPMASRSSITVDAEFEAIADVDDMALPASLEITSITGQPWRITYADPDVLVQMKQQEAVVRSELEQLLNVANAPPKHYTIIGSEFRFFPAPETAYTVEFTRYNRLPALSDANTTNWLLAAFPNAYLYGSLAQAMAWEGDTTDGKWDAAFQRAMAGVLDAYPVPTSGARLRTELPVGRRVFC